MFRRDSLSRANILSIINRPKRYVSRDALESQMVDWEAVKSFYQDKNWMLDRIEQLEYDPVSYTHLDVYKRQGLR